MAFKRSGVRLPLAPPISSFPGMLRTFATSGSMMCRPCAGDMPRDFMDAVISAGRERQPRGDLFAECFLS